MKTLIAFIGLSMTAVAAYFAGSFGVTGLLIVLLAGLGGQLFAISLNAS